MRGVVYKAIDIADIKERYDCITCIETLEHIPDEDVSKVIFHIYRCLNPGGIAIVCVPTTNRPREEKHFRHYDIAEIKREIKNSGVKFNNINYEYFWRVKALERYLKLTSNRFLYIRPRLLDNLLWKSSFRATEKNGGHLIMTLLK